MEGRNVNATLFEIYFKDPFLAYAYLGSIPFFVALYQAFKMLGDIERKKVFSRRSLKALRTIKHCALIVLGFVVPAVGYLFIVRPGDDIAGGVFMGLLITLGSILVVIGAAVFERRMRDAASTKSRSD